MEVEAGHHVDDAQPVAQDAVDEIGRLGGGEVAAERLFDDRIESEGF